VDTGIFYDGLPGLAKKFCARCPVRAECLVEGMTERYGIWGGYTPDERALLRRKQAIKEGRRAVTRRPVSLTEGNKPK